MVVLGKQPKEGVLELQWSGRRGIHGVVVLLFLMFYLFILIFFSIQSKTFYCLSN